MLTSLSPCLRGEEWHFYTNSHQLSVEGCLGSMPLPLALPDCHVCEHNKPRAEKALAWRCGPALPEMVQAKEVWAGCWQHLLHHPALVTSPWRTHGDTLAIAAHILAFTQTCWSQASSSLQSLPIIIPRRTQGVSHMYSQSRPVSWCPLGTATSARNSLY